MKESLLTILRDQNTGLEAFRLAANRLSDLLAAEASAAVFQEPAIVQTSLGKAAGFRMTHPVAVLPILRAGLTLLPSFLHLFPTASVGFFGLRRDEKTAQPIPYYENLPSLSKDHLVFLLDPMIATAGSSLYALERLEKLKVHPSRIWLVGFLAAAEGIQKIKEKFPYVNIRVAAEDKELNSKKFIVPGLGDFGDRYFGT